VINPRLLPEAEREWRAAARWYDQKRPGLGAAFSAAVYSRLREIVEWPKRFSRLETVRTRREFRRAKIRGFPYIVVFREINNIQVVYAISHFRRRPGYWLRRRP
jgi:hypothetical protein